VSLLVAGSIALDDLEGPFGRVSAELGGSALYFALAASLIGPVEVLAPVGSDAIDRVRDAVAGRRIDISRVALIDRPTYRWHARQDGAANVDLGSADGIYDRWAPDPGDWPGGWAFVGSMRPDRQLVAATALKPRASLLAGDSMRSYVTARPVEAGRVLDTCGWFFANREELRALGGDPDDAGGFRRHHRLEGLVVKADRHGCVLWTEAETISLPALRTLPVVDVTGAGDALAGGFLSHWHQAGGRPEELRVSLAHGVACASLAITAVGLRGLREASPAAVAELVAELLG
jgi:sugar/nucleoside kinase (ribokinase family)